MCLRTTKIAWLDSPGSSSSDIMGFMLSAVTAGYAALEADLHVVPLFITAVDVVLFVYVSTPCPMHFCYCGHSCMC